MKIILTIVAAICIFCVAWFVWAMKYDSVQIDDEGNIIDE